MQSGPGVEIIKMEQVVPGSGASRGYGEYRYAPLIAEDAVRVLVLEPADHFDSPLRCSITQHRRDSQSRSARGCEYSAVSYTWGDSGVSHQLLVRAGAESWSWLQITANVDSLLRHVRVSHKARLLWVDAICLNQKDEVEKTQQIPLMGRIYNDAKRVRIWLGGDEADRAQLAFTVIRDIEREYERKVTNEELQCLAEFFKRPWFTRRWVIQEAVFSHDAVFHCGIYKLGLSRMMAVLGKMQDAGGDHVVGHGARMLLTSVGSRHISKKGLLSLLWDLHEAECGDPRDRIAAVYALATDGEKPLLQYDSRNWKSIYMDVASYFIKHSPAFDFRNDAASAHAVLLHLCHFGPVDSETNDDFPSWVPDWSKRRESPPPFVSDEPSLYSCEEFKGRRNFTQVSAELFRILMPIHSEFWDSAKQKRADIYHSLKMYGPACMKSEVVRHILRLNYHPLVFFKQCGRVDRVIGCSTGPEFWHEVDEALEIPTIAESYHSDQDPSLKPLAQLLIERDRAAGEAASQRSYIEKILKEIHAHRADPDALGAQHETNLQYISTSLRRRSIMRVQASMQHYWAIGPPTAQVGDWIVPLLLPQQTGFIPTICLRPIHSKGADIRGPQLVPHAIGTGKHGPRLSGANIAEVDCVHVKARFVGPAYQCEPMVILRDERDCETMSKIIMKTVETARDRGLPGPVIFDVV